MPIALTQEGMEGAMALLKGLEKLGSQIGGVEMIGHERKDGKANNAEVLIGMAEGHYKTGTGERDFVSLDAGESTAVVQKLSDEITIGMDKAIKRINKRRKGQKLKGVMDKGIGKGAVNSIATKALIEAGKVWLEFINDHIDQGKWQGGGSHNLTEAYAAQKTREHGFIHPIGQASGELEDNLDMDRATANLKVRRKR